MGILFLLKTSILDNNKERTQLHGLRHKAKRTKGQQASKGNTLELKTSHKIKPVKIGKLET